MAARWILICAFALLAPTPPATAQIMRALPVDEATKDQTFATFREQFLNAVIDRDIDTLLSMVSQEIKLSHGGQSGLNDMRAMLTVDPNKLPEEYRHEAAALRERYWAALEDTLRLGGAFAENGTEFVSPWIWTLTLPAEMDAFEAYWVIGEGVAMRERPIRWGRKVATLDFDIANRLEGGDGTDFIKVQLADGTTGFVHEHYLRSYVDYRAIFRFSEGEWKMVTFMAGD